jgi:hypothetical protein
MQAYRLENNSHTVFNEIYKKAQAVDTDHANSGCN